MLPVTHLRIADMMSSAEWSIQGVRAAEVVLLAHECHRYGLLKFLPGKAHFVDFRQALALYKAHLDSCTRGQACAGLHRMRGLMEGSTQMLRNLAEGLGAFDPDHPLVVRNKHHATIDGDWLIVAYATVAAYKADRISPRHAQAIAELAISLNVVEASSIEELRDAEAELLANISDLTDDELRVGRLLHAADIEQQLAALVGGLHTGAHGAGTSEDGDETSSDEADSD